MKISGFLVALLLAVPAMAQPGSKADAPTAPQMTGQYVESRDGDIYPVCIANGQVDLIGRDAVLAWHVERGTWGNVNLDGLTIVAVVRASNTLGDPYSSPLPARAKLLVDRNANLNQRAALVNFVQEQAGELLANVVAVEALPIQFVLGQQRGMVTLRAGNELRLTTKALNVDMLPESEVASFPPLASHLSHAIPATSTESVYEGSGLGINWNESGRHGSFVGTFAQ
jgi:hypothetical protein